MKRILLPAALVLALSSGFTIAQEPQAAPPPPPPAKHHHAKDPHKAAMRLGEQLKLSADQTAKIEPIFADRDQKAAAIQANADLAPKDRKKQMHALQMDTEQQLSGILTPEQMEQMKSTQRGHHDKGATEPLAPTPPPSV